MNRPLILWASHTVSCHSSLHSSTAISPPSTHRPSSTSPPLGLLLQKLFVPQGGISPVYYLRNYGVLLVLGCVCSSALPHWLWEKISKNTVAKLLAFALLTALCVCYVVAATNATALYANF